MTEKPNKMLPALLLFMFLTLINCRENKPDDKTILPVSNSLDSLKKIQTEDSLLQLEKQKQLDIYPLITYKKVEIKTRKELYALQWKYRRTPETMHKYRALTTLNRKELRFFGIGQTILEPDTVINDLRAYSVFPQYYHGARNIPKIILISNKYQSYSCYEKGRLVRFTAVNTGKEKTPSYPGRYALVWKQQEHKSSLDSSWIMPFTWNFHADAGCAFHQFVMPGRPVSHSCIRQFIEDAEWLFYWGRGIRKDSTGKFKRMSGTPVIIIDHYDFNIKRGSWLNLASNKDSTLKLPPDPMAVEEALIPIIQIPETSRGNLINKSRYLYAEDTLRARGVIRPGIKLQKSIDFNKLKRQKLARELKIKAEKEAKLKKEQNNLRQNN